MTGDIPPALDALFRPKHVADYPDLTDFAQFLRQYEIINL